MGETLKIKDLPPESRPREAFMRSANPGEVVGIPLDGHVVTGRSGYGKLLRQWRGGFGIISEQCSIGEK